MDPPRWLQRPSDVIQKLKYHLHCTIDRITGKVQQTWLIVRSDSFAITGIIRRLDAPPTDTQEAKGRQAGEVDRMLRVHLGLGYSDAI